MTKRRDAFVAVLFLMLAVIFLRSMVFSKDSIGFNHDWLFPMTEDSLRIYYEKSFFAWSDQNLGYSVVYPAENILRFSTLPFIYLGLSGLDVVKIILVLALAIAGYSMYSLLRHTLKLLFAPSLIGGLLYLVSPVVFNKIVAGHIPYIIGYSLSPLMLSYFIKYSKTKKMKDLLVTALIIAYSSIQIQFLFMQLALIIVYSAVVCTSDIKMLTRAGVTIVLTFTLIHSFWILPLAASTASLQHTLESASSINDLRTWNTPIIDAIRMIGYRSAHFELLLQPPYKPIWDICSIILVLLAFASLLPPRRRLPLAFATIAILALIFTTALNSPFSALVYFLYSTIPLSNIFREVYHLVFLISFSYSVMIAASMQKLLALRDTNINWRTAMMALILAIIILTDPFIFSGDFCGQLQKYQLTGTDLNYIHAYELSPDDYRVLYLPMTAPLKYNNSTYDGLDPVIGYSEKATLGNYQMDQFTQGLSLAVYNSSKDVQNLMNLLSIKYVFYRYNYTSTVSKYLGEGSLLYFDNKPYNISLSWTNTNLLKTINQSDLDLVNRTRDLLIYEDRSALPHVYAAAKARIIDGSISDMFETISSRNYNTDQSVIFLSKQTNGEQMQLLDDIQNASSGIIKENAYPSSLEYIKINPTKYMVRISNATQPFFLVFNEGYDPRWKAYVGDGNSHLKGSDVDNGSRFDLGDIAYLIDQKPLEDRNHLEANGYGNAWLIEPQSIAKDKDGNFIIILYFLPQSLYYTGLIVSALTAMVCVAYLVLTWSNWRRDGKHSRLGSMIRRCFCHGRQFTARLAYVGTEFSI